MLTAFTDPATGEPRLVSGSTDVRVWNPAASGAAIEAEPEGHSDECECPGDLCGSGDGCAAGRDRVGDKAVRCGTRRLAVRCS